MAIFNSYFDITRGYLRTQQSSTRNGGWSGDRGAKRQVLEIVTDSHGEAW